MSTRTAATVLVVDDDRATRHLVRAVLTKGGFRVTVAKDGVDALAQLRGRRFDLMLLDVWMPRMDGMELLEHLKRRAARPKVVVMTSDDAPETLLRAVRQHAYQYVHKPVDPLALVSLVRETLKQRAAPRIEVVSARPNWVELVVPCTRDAAEHLHSVMTQVAADLPEDVRESVESAFRELLFNAVEWGGKLDPKRSVRIAYLRAKRMLMYRIADPGPGFRMADLDHAAISNPPDAPIEHMRIREEKGLRPGGFGLLVARAKVDELIFNEKQNEVVFVKYLD